MNRIMRQDIRQWGRCTIHDCIIKVKKPLRMVPEVFNSKKKFSELTHFKGIVLEINFDKIAGKVPIMCRYKGVQKKRSRQVTAYLV